jgi:hydroxymethylglutaryl-CoA reductase (NADPH)
MIDKLANGEIKLHELDSLIGENKAMEIRLKAVEKKLSVKLDSINSGSLSPEICKANIENMIGSCQIPLGLAGPVSINGENAKGEFFIPLATTEGALTASVNRGCSVINKSGGASALILKNEQSRSILFKANSITAAKKFSDRAEKNFAELKKAGEEGERFLEIKKIERYIVGLNIWLRIKADTKDAMGMNMVTIAGKKISEFISKNYEGIEFVSE